MSRVLIQNEKGEFLKDDPGAKPKNCNRQKITSCKQCHHVSLRGAGGHGSAIAPYCDIYGEHGRYILKHYWEHDRIASFCKLEDYKELPKICDRFKNLILEENDNASNKKGT